MDDLDRMFRRLIHNIRNGYPEYLTRPFEVAELYQTLIPYRHNRRELGMETAQDYELALCHLLAGERGYLVGDDLMQEALGGELGSPNPNTAMFREFAATRVALSPEALRRYDQLMADAGSTPPPPGAPASTVRMVSPASPGAPPVSEPAAGAVAPANPDAAGGTSVWTQTTSTGAAEQACRYCGGTLPNGRRVVFCPHCGQNLTVQRCPACSTELELDWKFCITCGRDATLT